MVQTRHGTHASPEPQQSFTEVDEPVSKASQQRQTRSTGKAHGLNLKSLKSKRVPKEVLSLLLDESASSSRPTKKRRIQQDQDQDDEQSSSEDRVEEGLLDMVRTVVQGSHMAQAENPDAQLQREASERPQTAVDAQSQQQEGSHQEQTVSSAPVSSERDQQTSTGPEGQQQSSFEDDDDLSSLEADENPVSADDVADAEEAMFLGEKEGELVFPELPNMGDKDIVYIKVGGLRNMLHEISRLGWTGYGPKWERQIDKDLRPGLETGQSYKTEHCKRLRHATSRLSRIFSEASSEITAEKQVEFLREKANDIKVTVEFITRLVKRICEKLATPQADEELSRKDLRQRRHLTQDMLHYGIPSVLIVLRETFQTGGVDLYAKNKGTFTSVALDYLIVETKWLQWLVAATLKEIEERPFEPEFASPDNELSQGDQKTKQRKSKTRQGLRASLKNFHLGVIDGIIDFYERKSAEKKRKQEAEARQWKLEMAQREEHRARMAEKREREKRKEETAQKWEAMCASTQGLRRKANPLEQKWDDIMEEDRAYSEKWAAMSASTHSLRDVPDPLDVLWASRGQRPIHPLDQAEDDPFGDEVEQGQPHLEPDQPSTPAWPAWDADEDAVVFEALKYSRTLNIPRIANTLHRDEHDVKQRVQELKESRTRPRAVA